MKKIFLRLAAVCLCLTLFLSTALAARGFEQTISYSPFPDLAGHWAEPYARVCVQTGLMRGTGDHFAPDAQITNAEVAAIAARIHAAFAGVELPPQGTPWYQCYLDYLAQAGIVVHAPRAYANRYSFFTLLSAVLPDSELQPINSIRALPDTSDPAVLKFYNAGILTGIDAYGTFDGSAPLTRGQCAAMAARIADPALRRRFTPAGQIPAAEYPDDAVVMTLDGEPATYGDFREVLLSLTEEVMDLYIDYGLPFHWEGGYGIQNWNDTLRQAARHTLAAQILAQRKAAELGCTVENLALTLFGAPTEEELTRAALEQGLDRYAPGVEEQLTEEILEEKLNSRIALWVEEASIVTTPIYEKISPEGFWNLYN